MVNEWIIKCRRRAGGHVWGAARLGLWGLAAAVALGLASPAVAADRSQEVLNATAAPSVIQLGRDGDRDSMSAVFSNQDAVATAELASQRGGTSNAVPIAPAAQSTPQIILWDELKSQTPTNPSTQGTNTMILRIR